MTIVLGTAQWGLAYGIAGHGRPATDTEVQSILERAAQVGICRIDTAQLYGNIEARLRALLPRSTAWRVTTKIPPVPADLPPTDVAVWVETAVALSETRLGDTLEAVLLHDTAVLDDAQRAAPAWEALQRACESRGVRPGVSVYAPGELARLCKYWGVRQAQLPGNALDQRLRDVLPPAGVVRHVRSVFLQGLLLNESAAPRLRAATEALQRWRVWCAERGLAPGCAALSVARSLDPGAEGFVIGVETLAQLNEVLLAWQESRPLAAPQLRCDDPAVIDPRRWTIAA
jgi:hypothetical protein